MSNYILWIFFLIIVIWLYKHHISNYHEHSYKSYRKSKMLVAKPKMTKMQIADRIFYLVVLILLIICVLTLFLSDKENILLIALIGATFVIIAEHAYFYFKNKVQWYLMITKPALDKIISEQDAHIVEFLMLLTKTNKVITQDYDKQNNQSDAICLLNDYGFVCVRKTNVGNTVIASINQLYRTACKWYFHKYHKERYRLVCNEHLNNWLQESITNNIDMKDKSWNVGCLASHQFAAQDISNLSGPLIVINGAVELLIVAISVFSNKFSPTFIFTLFISTVILMLIGYYNTKNKDRLLSIVGLIMSITATFVSIVALIVALIDISNQSARIIGL